MARSAGVEPVTAWFIDWFLFYESLQFNELPSTFIAINKGSWGSEDIPPICAQPL